MIYRTLLCLSMVLFSVTVSAQAVIKLYAESIPNSRKPIRGYLEKNDHDWVVNVSVPTLTYYAPQGGNNNGAAIIICPGGAYAGLAIGHEGNAVAEAFSRIGVSAFVLKYRLPSDSISTNKSIIPLQDAQRALQLVRSRAQSWGIDTGRIGVIGFSAGGHLASTLATHFSKAVIANPEHTNLRPSFAMLIYPVISMGIYTHQGSKENLIGKNPDKELVDLFSNEKQITAQTPPTFLIHSGDDTVVPVQNSLMYYEALIKAGVRSEMHLFPSGGHGYGLNNPTTNEAWFEYATAWLKQNKWI